MHVSISWSSFVCMKTEPITNSITECNTGFNITRTHVSFCVASSTINLCSFLHSTSRINLLVTTTRIKGLIFTIYSIIASRKMNIKLSCSLGKCLRNNWLNKIRLGIVIYSPWVPWFQCYGIMYCTWHLVLQIMCMINNFTHKT